MLEILCHARGITFPFPMTAPNAGMIDKSQSRSYAFVREDI